MTASCSMWKVISGIPVPVRRSPAFIVQPKVAEALGNAAILPPNVPDGAPLPSSAELDSVFNTLEMSKPVTATSPSRPVPVPAVDPV